MSENNQNHDNGNNENNNDNNDDDLNGKDKKKDKNSLDILKLEILDKMANFVVEKDLAVVAIMFLESIRPLHYLGGQAIIFFEPFLSILINEQKIVLFREAMEDRRYLEYLINKIEELNNK